MKHFGGLFAALILLSGCGSAIGPNQADGSDCNYSTPETACVAASFCDPGVADGNGVYPRSQKYGDKSHVVGTCKPKGAAGAGCLGKDQCVSGQCTHAAAGALGSKGVCQ